MSYHRGTEGTEFLFVSYACGAANIKYFSLCPLCLCGEMLFIFTADPARPELQPDLSCLHISPDR